MPSAALGLRTTGSDVPNSADPFQRPGTEVASQLFKGRGSGSVLVDPFTEPLSLPTWTALNFLPKCPSTFGREPRWP